ncbi:hypothetical protein M5252_003363 [Vibrio parahaemolyticus]|nr:hypothetical protein [Vibrio parahaemolyticus]EJB1761172.1 hypothetical protein [Vibrio parahaemolyticus]EJE8512547.1 hypothetical protein [Vibrio parahaemolyticus]EJE8773875.1 hypothetical protein [Vibrio parahaemolyticus]
MLEPASFLLLFIVCMIGYSNLLANPKTRHDMLSSEGYHTFFKSALKGVEFFFRAFLLFLLGALIAKITGWHLSISSYIATFAFHTKLPFYQAALSDMSLVAWFLSLFGPAISYRFSSATYDQMLTDWFAQNGNNSEFTEVIFRSFEYGLPILFTMSDRKVYVGYALEVPMENFNDIHIIPLYSGYRREEDNKLQLVSPYAEVIADLEDQTEEQVNLEEFLVTLPVREVLYAHLHNFEYMEAFADYESRGDCATSSVQT